MNSLPCIASRDADHLAHVLGLEAKREEWTENRSKDLKAEYRSDLEVISDCTADVLSYRVGYTNHPKALQLLTLIRDGSDATDLGTQLRKVVMDAVDAKAEKQAEDEAEALS